MVKAWHRVRRHRDGEGQRGRISVAIGGLERIARRIPRRLRRARERAAVMIRGGGSGVAQTLRQRRAVRSLQSVGERSIPASGFRQGQRRYLRTRHIVLRGHGRRVRERHYGIRHYPDDDGQGRLVPVGVRRRIGIGGGGTHCLRRSRDSAGGGGEGQPVGQPRAARPFQCVGDRRIAAGRRGQFNPVSGRSAYRRAPLVALHGHCRREYRNRVRLHRDAEGQRSRIGRRQVAVGVLHGVGIGHCAFRGLRRAGDQTADGIKAQPAGQIPGFRLSAAASARSAGPRCRRSPRATGDQPPCRSASPDSPRRPSRSPARHCCRSRSPSPPRRRRPRRSQRQRG